MEKESVEGSLEDMKGKALLLLSSREGIHSDFSNLIRTFVKDKGMNGVIVCFRNPALMEKEHIDQAGLDSSKLYFIDCVTVAADFMPEQKNVFFILNNKDLGGIRMGLNNFLGREPNIDFVILDVLDVLLYYNSIEKIKDLMTFIRDRSKSKPFALLAFVNKDNLMLLDNLKESFDSVTR
ncbi:MAG: hypothetical protein V1866_01570 [archaeon]